jgi:hypothetical protein
MKSGDSETEGKRFSRSPRILSQSASAIGAITTYCPNSRYSPCSHQNASSYFRLTSHPSYFNNHSVLSGTIHPSPNFPSHSHRISFSKQPGKSTEPKTINDWEFYKMNYLSCIQPAFGVVGQPRTLHLSFPYPAPCGLPVALISDRVFS